MELTTTLVAGAVGLALGAGLTLLLRRGAGERAREEAERDARRIEEEARSKAEHIRREAELSAKDELLARKEAQEKEFDATRKDLREEERRLQKLELAHEEQVAAHTRRQRMLTDVEERVASKQKEVQRREGELEGLLREQRRRLEELSGLDTDGAREELLRRIRADVADEEERLVARSEENLRSIAEEKARDILSTAIGRVAADHSSEITVSTVDLPTDDVKGRVIGREGRNIRAFEKAAGVDVIVDDTPGIVLVSAFDGVRREIARRAMTKLVKDGRIHPGRIEQVVGQTRSEMQEHIAESGKRAVLDVDIGKLHPKLVHLMGRLEYRTSYGQNVLRHSIEAAHVCGAIAAELGLDVKLAKRCALLHDVGKAVDHEVEGGHPAIGADIARRCGESDVVVNAIAAHHNDVPMETAYAVITAAADAVSAARPGARRDTLERYIQRLQRLEEIASRFEGVDQAYAIQAGREIRVMVNPNQIGDRTSQRLAREIARTVEEELTYPGEVKVTLLRELRVTDYAR